MSELPFSRPADFEHCVSCESPGEGHWFVFRGDQLLVEVGPLGRPSDDLRVRARPAWARLPLQKNHNWLGALAARTLYLGRLAGTDLWAAELAAGVEPPPGMSWEGL